MKPKPVLLAIFGGFELNPSRAHNAWALGRTPTSIIILLLTRIPCCRW